MLVKDFMTPNVLTISEDKSMLEAPGTDEEQCFSPYSGCR